MSGDGDDTTTMGAQVPVETAEVAKEKLEYGEWSEYARELAEVIAFGDGFNERTPYDVVIAKKKDELDHAREMRAEWESEVQSLTEEIENLKQEREEYKTTEDQFEGALWQLEQDFRAGEIGHLDETQPKIKNLAERFDKTPESLMETLRQRNPDVPQYAFKPLQAVREKFWGLPDDDVATPVGNRESGRDAD